MVWDGCLNTRDLGGLPVADGGEIQSGSLIRSDNLTYLNAAGIEAVRRSGISRIIDLRFPGEGTPLPDVTPAPEVDHRQIADYFEEKGLFADGQHRKERPVRPCSVAPSEVHRPPSRRLGQ